MAEKAKKTANNTKNNNTRSAKKGKNCENCGKWSKVGLLVGIVAVIVVVVGIIVAAVTINQGGSGVSESMFVSDDKKLVLTIDLGGNEEEGTPTLVHLVYYYNGDDITGMEAYYKYTSADAAQAAYKLYNDSATEAGYASVKTSGVYVILVAEESEYEGITVEDVRQQIELMELIQNSQGELYDDVEVVELDEDEIVEIEEVEE